MLEEWWEVEVAHQPSDLLASGSRAIAECGLLGRGSWETTQILQMDIVSVEGNKPASSRLLASFKNSDSIKGSFAD